MRYDDVSKLINGACSLMECSVCGRVFAMQAREDRCPGCGVRSETAGYLMSIRVFKSRPTGDPEEVVHCIFNFEMSNVPKKIRVDDEAGRCRFVIDAMTRASRAAAAAVGRAFELDVVACTRADLASFTSWSCRGSELVQVDVSTMVPDDAENLRVYCFVDEAGRRYLSGAIGALVMGRRAATLGDA